MKVIHDDFVPGRKGGAWVVKRGQFIKVTDVDGGAIGNFVTFNANNLKERLDQGRTKADNGKFLISKGDHLYTRDNNVLLTIVEDTYGIHDLQYGMCSAWIFEQYHQRKADGNYHGFTNRFTVGGPMGVPRFGCYEVLQRPSRIIPSRPRTSPTPSTYSRRCGSILRRVHWALKTAGVSRGTILCSRPRWTRCAVSVPALPREGRSRLSFTSRN